MQGGISRREFLALAGLSALGVASAPPPPEDLRGSLGIARVTTSWINLYREPSFRAKRLAKLMRDELVTLLARELADEGPPHNPVWYRIGDGYLHSGRLQLVRWEPQAPVDTVPDDGALFEVCVPYTRAHRKPDPASGPLYRLYYQSTAWVQARVMGADGRLWYRLIDDLLRVRYYARAEHFRMVPTEELSPISADVPAHKKHIEVHLASQELRAFEYDRLVLRTSISSGIPNEDPTDNGVPTATPTGEFYIEVKMPLRHMGDGNLTSDLEAYELPGVPWVSFFHITGVGFHGTYWHNDYGRPMSHGCVNMRPEEAKWLYRWSTPIVDTHAMKGAGRGTRVMVV